MRAFAARRASPSVMTIYPPKVQTENPAYRKEQNFHKRAVIPITAVHRAPKKKARREGGAPESEGRQPVRRCIRRPRRSGLSPRGRDRATGAPPRHACSAPILFYRFAIYDEKIM